MAFLQWIGGALLKILVEKVWGLIAIAIALMKRKKDDSSLIDENLKKVGEAEKSGDEERETRETENLLNGNKS